MHTPIPPTTKIGVYVCILLRCRYMTCTFRIPGSPSSSSRSSSSSSSTFLGTLICALVHALITKCVCAHMHAPLMQVRAVHRAWRPGRPSSSGGTGSCSAGCATLRAALQRTCTAVRRTSCGGRGVDAAHTGVCVCANVCVCVYVCVFVWCCDLNLQACVWLSTAQVTMT